MTNGAERLTDNEKRLIALGNQCDRDHMLWSLSRCNCMVRYGSGDSLPAIKLGKKNVFTTPEGDEIVKPDSWEVMTPRAISEIMKNRGEIYIGHLFPIFNPTDDISNEGETPA